VKLQSVSALDYYGRGYQDVQSRVPAIANTRRDLDWRPRVGLRDALKRIFDAYRQHVAEARQLVY
jgi:nucleoside-diphosphate-sugar epimerase